MLGKKSGLFVDIVMKIKDILIGRNIKLKIITATYISIPFLSHNIFIDAFTMWVPSKYIRLIFYHNTDDYKMLDTLSNGLNAQSSEWANLGIPSLAYVLTWQQYVRNKRVSFVMFTVKHSVTSYTYNHTYMHTGTQLWATTCLTSGYT